MKRFYLELVCFLQVSLIGCVDYVKMDEESMLNELHSFPPVIDTQYLSPHPSSLINTISLGKNCSVVFKVPPIKDKNPNDTLYYLWFLDNRLVLPQSTIAPEFRDSGIITLTIDEQFLLSHFEPKAIKDFFSRPHLIEFFVSDVVWQIPESRYLDESKQDGKNHVDYAYWIVNFNNDPC
ncbi:MAG: hypothetical protein KC505_05620 [Myxococcales bacterium]|nr:hypothetical protein [Myxococcales bacterium]USN51741.1 MAG: hypothetical protein H6731_04860 [Myxococcales bacterium]